MVKFKTLNVKSVKDNGTYVFGDFSIGLYYLDTPRLLGEQLGSLAITGGQNIWAEKGALVPQYGYKVLDRLPEDEIVVAVSKDSGSSSTFFIITLDENQNSVVYLYTASQGLKKYKTSLGLITDPILCHDGNNLIIYDNGVTQLFGDFYKDGTTRTLINSNVTGLDWDNYYEFRIPVEDLSYYWNGKPLSITDSSGNHKFTVTAVTNIGDEYFTIRCNWNRGDASESDPDVSSPVSIFEQTVLDVSDLIIFTDEDETVSEVIDPYLMEVAQNRLFMVDMSGRIYYSAIGGVDMLAGREEAFAQVNDAGYFEGFYRDSSKVLSIEDFMDGILLCKENGIYYLTLEAPTYNITPTGSDSEGMLSLGNMQLKIKKIANIGQQYAGDHVIVRESVIAYDSNSGTIVNAASVNVFNTIVAGDVIIDSRALNAYNTGITASKRLLTYNGQENVFIMYFGEDLTNGVVLKMNATLFPRKLDNPMFTMIGFNQGVAGVGKNGIIIQDFRNGTIIENIPAYADFEAIGVRDNRAVSSSILEVTELNGVEYTVTTKNTGTSVQTIHPNINVGLNETLMPPLLYSDKEFNIISDSYELTSRWADKKAHVMRVAAPMSGREGVSISIEFPKNTSFCLAALRLPDFSLGEI